jgi:methylthioribose-1-phosphate isomerase
VEALITAGRYLARHDLVREAEGNLSSFQDAGTLRITRAGARLGQLTWGDVLEGRTGWIPPGASSDARIHQDHYEHWRNGLERGAVVHAHPAGTVPDGWREGQPHGIYASGPTIEDALAAVAVHERRSEWPEQDPESRAPRWIRLRRPVEYQQDSLLILDQTRLPEEESWITCRTVEDVCDAIRRLAVRGAPALGLTSAWTLALVLRRMRGSGADEVREALEKAAAMLVGSRPTAVNIQWAVERIRARIARSDDGELAFGKAVDAALDIEQEDARACSLMGRRGAVLVPERARVLTHCNTGMLCTAGIGTAMGVIWCAHLAGKDIHVWVDETRPALQGARLTALELNRLAVPFTLIADVAAGSLLARGRVDVVVVGADRVAANGDVANKVGTYPLALLAREHGVPFYVVAPTSTIDPATPSGSRIPIEERDPGEVTSPRGMAIAPEGARAHNPAFDVTPSRLVSAIVTERGVARPPYERSLSTLLDEAPEWAP